MTHRFPIKEIARQAGLGTATVDRALNQRGYVSPQSQRRVTAAIEELTEQEAQLAARGRRLFFDFVVEAPTRFSREVKLAAEAVMPQIGTAVCRSRFIQNEIMDEEELITELMRIMKRGSHGVCLKAQDTPQIREAVNTLSMHNIPVVTLVTDIEGTERCTYVGLDNAGAGRTAAYLIAKTVGDIAGSVLTSRSHERFLGEEERETAFTESLAELCPKLRIVAIQGGYGVHTETARILNDVIKDIPDICAVYSMGGGNRSILETLTINKLCPRVFVAHDLDQENRNLIMDRKLDFILYHDLRSDIKNAFNAFLAYHRLSKEQTDAPLSPVQVLTPENIPD